MILKNFPYDSWSLLVQLELQASRRCAALCCACADSDCLAQPRSEERVPLTAPLPARPAPPRAAAQQDTTQASHPGLRLIPSASGLTPVA